MNMILMRHSDALSRQEAEVPYDADRPLSETGRRDAARAGAVLQRNGLAPAAVVCSPFVRTQETAKVVAGTLDAEVAVAPRTELAPGSGPDELLRSIEELDAAGDDWILAVLHQPDVGHILGCLLCAGAAWPLDVHTSDLFALAFDHDDATPTPALRAYWAVARLPEGRAD